MVVRHYSAVDPARWRHQRDKYSNYFLFHSRKMRSARDPERDGPEEGHREGQNILVFVLFIGGTAGRRNRLSASGRPVRQPNTNPGRGSGSGSGPERFHGHNQEEKEEGHRDHYDGSVRRSLWGGGRLRPSRQQRIRPASNGQPIESR